MATQLMLTAGLVFSATVLGSKAGASNFQDKIVELRDDARQTERALVEKENKQEFTGSRRGSSFFLDKKRTTRESYVRKILENMFRLKFPSVRPEWLVNPKTNRRMEIDCFCKEMNLGYEVQGIQHSKYIPYFHQTYQGYLDMVDRDVMKSAIVQRKGVKLIRIPHNVPDNELESFILSATNAII